MLYPLIYSFIYYCESVRGVHKTEESKKWAEIDWTVSKILISVSGLENEKSDRAEIDWYVFVRLNLINHFVGFIPCQFACNSAFRNPVFMWDSCKGSVWKSVKKRSRVCTQQGLATRFYNWLAIGKSPKEAHVCSMQGSWRVTLAGAL